jgi:prevent-host-death family protein
MAPKTIPQRRLRNEIGQILREAEQGQEFTITVRGKPVASLGPPPSGRRLNVDARTVARVLEVPIDREDFEADLDAAEAPVT